MRNFAAAAMAITLIAMGCGSKSTELKDLPTSYISTFKLTGPDRIVVEEFVHMSDSVPAKKRVIKDDVQIKKIVAVLFSLPDEGDIMKKLADVPMTRLSFVFSDHIETLEFYDGRVKTPATSFYSEQNPMEPVILDLVQSGDPEK